MTPATTRLTELGVDFGVHEYERDGERTDFGAEAAAALGVPSEQVFKTLLVDVEGGGTGTETVVVVLPVDDSASMKAVASAAGAKRAMMCEPRRAERLTGCVVGGISPIGQRTELRTVVDESAIAHERVYVSGGRRGLDLSLTPDDLVAVTGATVADVTS